MTIAMPVESSYFTSSLIPLPRRSMAGMPRADMAATLR
jgi:hypothetical protein